MNNILIDRLPTSVWIDGREYQLDTDFRTCLRIILAFEDPDLADVEKRIVLIENLYPEPPNDLEKAVELGIWFLDGGENDPSAEKDGADEKLYSFSKDAPFIYSAFRQTHAIDLETVDHLHWWKFLYLFMDLGEEAFFVRLISLRSRLADGTASKDEKKAAKKMEKLLEVPQNRNMNLVEMESANRFMELLEKGDHETES
ncbi:MAG: bacteriophage Gp15 family protein [Anaerolineaceae bacterium]|nr:bacteriophage Gp15 family protein [Anaerolineaceae bacterium]